MNLTGVNLMLVVVGLATGSPTVKSSFWKGTAFDTTIEEMKTQCGNEDAIACLKYKFMSLLDNLFQKDTFKITDDVKVSRNSYTVNEVSSRSESSLEENIQGYIQSHDVTFNLPLIDSAVTVGAQDLDKNEIDFKLKFSNSEVEARKPKLKKIMMPIFIFILLKAITLIPLALGILGLKAWNALQLSFFSFVVSIALAVFQLCKKIAADNVHPPIAAHGPWDGRSFDTQPIPLITDEEDAQSLAYSAYI